MRHVLILDDDVNGLTPPACLERLHRPWLERGLPINLAVIPKVYTDLSRPGGAPEGFLCAKDGPVPKSLALDQCRPLAEYLRSNPQFELAIHGYHHSELEFDRDGETRSFAHWRDVVYRLDHAEDIFQLAGLPRPDAFLPPYGELSREALAELGRRFRVVCSQRFPQRCVPFKWWPASLWRRLNGREHWRAGKTRLVVRPEEPLRPVSDSAVLIADIEQRIAGNTLTVLPVRWCDFHPQNRADDGAIAAWHRLAEWFSARRDVKLASFSAIARDEVPLA